MVMTAQASLEDYVADTTIDCSLFAEPEGYHPRPPPPTNIAHRLSSGRTLDLRLVGHDPLWVVSLSLPPMIGFMMISCTDGLFSR